MKRIVAILLVVTMLISLTACVELPTFSAKDEAFSYRDLETQLNRFAKEDGAEGIVSMDTIEYPRKLQSGALQYYVTYWDGLFSIYITEMDGQVVVIQSITNETEYASRHAEKTREEWAAVAAYPFVLCENGLKKTTVGKWHASTKEKEGYVWSDSLCTYQSEAWSYSWTQDESTIFITANHESYTPGGEGAILSADTAHLTHDVLIERLNGFATEIGMVGVGEVTSESKGADEIKYNFKCFNELIDVNVTEKDGKVVKVTVVTFQTVFPEQLDVEGRVVMAFTLATAPLVFCESDDSSMENVIECISQKFVDATVENENGTEIRKCSGDVWEYYWLTMVDVGGLSYYMAIDKEWKEANSKEGEYIPTLPTTTTTAPQETGRLTYLDATTPIYSAPGYHYTYLGTVGQSTNYTIVEEKSIGGEIWGKLKSGRGWVPLSMAPGDITDERWDVNYTVYLNAGTTIYGTPSPSRAVGTITQTTYYTIIEERVNNSGHWGKLKSGLGWIDLEDQATPTRAPQTSPTTTRTTTRATTRTTTRATTTTTRLDIDSDAYFEEEQIVS